MISRQRVPRGRLSLQGLNKRCDLRFATPLFTLHSTLATPHSSLIISYSSHYYKVYSIVRHTTYHNVQCTLQYVVRSTQNIILSYVRRNIRFGFEIRTTRKAEYSYSEKHVECESNTMTKHNAHTTQMYVLSVIIRTIYVK